MKTIVKKEKEKKFTPITLEVTIENIQEGVELLARLNAPVEAIRRHIPDGKIKVIVIGGHSFGWANFGKILEKELISQL